MNLILGTMTFGPQVNREDSLTMVKRFLDEGYNKLDTAYVYNNGDTEKILGDILSRVENKTFSLATKIHPRITGKLDVHALTVQFEESLVRLKRDSVDILYFHFPDPITPVEEALKECDKLYKNGKIKELGLSNFPAWMVVDIWYLCKENGWIMPTVYQGMYNGLTRKVEVELFPALRKLGIRFYAFNPLAGGILTGKHTSYEKSPASGRFARLESYRNRYWKKSYIDAANTIKSKCTECGVEPTDAAYRWLAYHSHLDGRIGDGIIIGASRLEQLEQNLTAIKNGSLPELIVDEFNRAWDGVKGDSPPYFRYFTK